MTAPPPLELDALLDAAGAGDVDPTAPWVEALGRLVRSAADEGGLTPDGAAATATKLSGLVADRLRADSLLRDHPEAQRRSTPVRFVVAGLARSGTTVLHRLLACDPDVSFLPTWQAFQPVPPTSGPDRRRDDAVARVEQIRRADPDALKAHPLDPDAPEEEVFLLQHSFASMLFALTCPLPSYSAWLNTTDHTEAYRFALDLIRLNDAVGGAPGDRPRVMKSPQYVLDLDVVARLVPDAVVVQTHRDPVDLVGSYCSVYEQSRRRWCEHVDRPALGEERLAQLSDMAARSAEARAAADARGEGGRFVDVDYDELVADPVGVVERLHAAAGVDLAPAARRAVERWVDEHPQHAAGRHEYALADYGLDRERIEERLASWSTGTGADRGAAADRGVTS